ncbi:hypothetical protein [Altererythrobacter aquiaggeris]|uniref:hypothetical protein n=1 Tax=Aestuarierythrobacter aquiaggeris TaxID=1898396 RepID=UPI00301AABB7
MSRLTIFVLSLIALCWSPAALADVKVSFHSFNGSVLVGRYPHTFVVFEGTLDDGTAVNENYGFTAKSVSPAILSGPVAHEIGTEKQKYVNSTNRHFTITVSDDKYRALVAEMVRWRDAPGKYYDLDSRNCIHFVGKMAQMIGVEVAYPKKMLRRPKQWLNHIASLNPQLGAKPVK